MGLILRTFAGGTVDLAPADTASNLTVNVQAANGVLTHADSMTGGIYLAAGTTAQRPATPVIGMMRYNTTTGFLETYNGSAWS
jgi:hypothetical protein